MKKSLFTLAVLPLLVLTSCGGPKAVSKEKWAEEAAKACEGASDVKISSFKVSINEHVVVKGLKEAEDVDDQDTTTKAELVFTYNTEEEKWEQEGEYSNLSKISWLFCEYASDMDAESAPETVKFYTNPLSFNWVEKGSETEDGVLLTSTNRTYVVFGAQYGFSSKGVVEEKLTAVGTFHDIKVNAKTLLTVSFTISYTFA